MSWNVTGVMQWVVSHQGEAVNVPIEQLLGKPLTRAIELPSRSTFIPRLPGVVAYQAGVGLRYLSGLVSFTSFLREEYRCGVHEVALEILRLVLADYRYPAKNRTRVQQHARSGHRLRRGRPEGAASAEGAEGSS